MKNVFICIGTNLGHRENNIVKAVEKISENVGTVSLFSSIYETEPWGFHSDVLFLNQVIKVATTFSPSVLLGKVLKIESSLGRLRGPERYSPRLIDIDILLYEDNIIDKEKLKIPHPLLHERKFVLVPLCEIAPEILHPVLKKTISELLDICKDNNIVRKHL